MKKCAFYWIVCFIGLVQAAFAYDLDIVTDASIGMRKDRIEWSVFSAGTPDKLFKEKWSNIRLAQLSANLQILACDHLLFTMECGYGWIFDHGKHTFTDFNVSLHPPTIEDEITSITKGHADDLSISAGYQFNWVCSGISMAPLIGYSYHFIKLNNHEFERENPSQDSSLKPIDELTEESKYHFSGPWVGFAVSYQPQCEWIFYFSYAYHQSKYHGSFTNSLGIEGNAHQKIRDVRGNEYTLGTAYNFTEEWFGSFKLNYRNWLGKNGHYITDKPVSSVLPLRSLRWSSFAATIEAGYLF